jgi:acetoin utilization deacetylase AcuC-like enzyme
MFDIVYFYPENHQKHAHPGHPERPERVEAIRTALKGAGWWDPYPHLNPLEFPMEVLASVHTAKHLSFIEYASKQGGRLDPDTYLTPHSWELALQAVGGGASVALAVWGGDAKRGFALTRPPGHHATPDRAMGFCLLNNIALAAEFLLQENGAERVAIVDIDLHHGNGTQDIFWQRGDVMFISTHQVPLYPGTGYLDETGSGDGAGTTVNIPMPPLSGDSAYDVVMDEIILPLLDRFAPEMVLVSAGMDVHWRDPLGNLLLSADAYGKLVARLTRWADDHCQGRIVLFLEGGYDLEGGSACATAAVAALLDQPFEDPIGPPSWKERADWRSMVRQAKEIWGT